jgi:AraC-like DNA-binding protein
MKTNHVLTDLSSIDWPAIAAEAHYQASLVAKRLKVAPRTLQREFQRQLHTTPKKFLAEARANAIKELARQHVRTKDIRLRLEYKHDSEVCRRFQAAFGTSLKEYRDTAC